jgi:hypothetical protein
MHVAVRSPPATSPTSSAIRCRRTKVRPSSRTERTSAGERGRPPRRARSTRGPTYDVHPGQGCAASSTPRSSASSGCGSPTTRNADSLVRVGAGRPARQRGREGGSSPASTPRSPRARSSSTWATAWTSCAIPASATGVLTSVDRGHAADGMGFANTPTVPVAHFNVTGSPVGPYTIAAGTPLRAATGDLVPVLGGPTTTLLDPSTFSPAKPGCRPRTSSSRPMAPSPASTTSWAPTISPGTTPPRPTKARRVRRSAIAWS